MGLWVSAYRLVGLGRVYSTTIDNEMLLFMLCVDTCWAQQSLAHNGKFGLYCNFMVPVQASSSKMVSKERIDFLKLQSKQTNKQKSCHGVAPEFYLF